MVMSKLIIDILIFAFAAVVFWYYARMIFGSPYKVWVQLLSVFLSYTALFGIYELNSMVFINIGYVVIHSLLFVFVFKAKFKSAILHAVLLPVALTASEFITIILYSQLFKTEFEDFQNSMITYGIENFISKLLYFAMCVILIRIFSKNENIKNQNYLSILLVPFSNIFIMIVFRYIIYKIDITSTIYYLWWVALILSTISGFFVFISYNRTIKRAEENAELKVENQKYEAEQKSFELVATANEEMRRISHDYKNQLIQISHMDDVDEIHHYIEPYLSEIDTVTKVGISKNPTLDLIISKYTMICNNKKITFHVDVKSSNLSYIQDYELTSLMCNLLDNAVEAAENSAEKKIELRIVAKNKLQDILIISNSCDEAPKQKSGKLLTSKPDKQFHGIGSKSILRVVKKYNGVYDWEYGEENKIFETTIVFPKQNIIDNR